MAGQILYNYQPYDFKRKGLFKIDVDGPGAYGENGWLTNEEERIIIGEDDNSYVTRLLDARSGEWVGGIVVDKTYVLPIGIHKSRFIKWLDTQLTIFR